MINRDSDGGGRSGNSRGGGSEGSEGIPTYMEAFVTEDQLNTQAEMFLWKLDLSHALSQLTPQQHRTLTLRYGLGGCMPQSVDTTAKLMGITPEWVRRNILSALEKLRKCPITEEILNNPPRASDIMPDIASRVKPGKAIRY